MKVYLPAILGHVPDKMVRATAAFLEFCYTVRREVLDDNDIDKLDELLAKFHTEREIFREEEIRPDGFCLPRQHSLVHYRELIVEFGAPNGLCSSITESKHIKAVKELWHRSSKFNALYQMLSTNQCIDQLAATRIEFNIRGMLGNGLPCFVDPPDKPPDSTQTIRRDGSDDDDGGDLDGEGIITEVQLAQTASACLTNSFFNILLTAYSSKDASQT